VDAALPGLDATEKAVLIAYASFAHDNGTSIFPSKGLVALKAACSLRTVIRATHRLLSLSYLVATGDRHYSRPDRYTQEYRIPVALIEAYRIEVSDRLPAQQDNHRKNTVKVLNDVSSSPSGVSSSHTGVTDRHGAGCQPVQAGCQPDIQLRHYSVKETPSENQSGLRHAQAVAQKQKTMTNGKTPEAKVGSSGLNDQKPKLKPRTPVDVFGELNEKGECVFEAAEEGRAQ